MVRYTKIIIFWVKGLEVATQCFFFFLIWIFSFLSFMMTFIVVLNIQI